ncbi:hypothetical protein [Streptomyces zagrosensis]|uniref:Uncharacterized protein n=1 Tax=Streptomyces zagrosensis TaxID=1042984 RepID=A0A7W9QDQ2_9ACTN|nr:hypothetical protein [Streptomyces zagrosensis]MBB5937843.1 hypothetical protein [Streptomyces zagrosensis]
MPTAPDYTLSPRKFPATSAEALRFARQAAVEPTVFGPDFARESPFEDDPGRWAVLDERCVWQREKLPRGALTSLAQHSKLPAQGGKGPVEGVTVVSVHRDIDSADQEMATTLEEVLRCPRQQLSADEEVSGLISTGSPWGKRGQKANDDMIWETGTYTNRSMGQSSPYGWATARLGPVTVSVTVKGSKGHTAEELDTILRTPLVQILANVKNTLI